MFRIYRRTIVVTVGCLIIVSFSVGLCVWLYPKQITLSSNDTLETTGLQERKGCSAAEIKLLTQSKQSKKRGVCEETASEREEQRNSDIQARRSADATEAEAFYAFEQARVAAIGISLSLITMLAAIAAAIFTGLAAHFTKQSGEAARESARYASDSLQAFVRVEDAYLIISFSSGIVTKHENSLEIAFDVVIENIGRSPAVAKAINIQNGNMIDYGDEIVKAGLKTVQRKLVISASPNTNNEFFGDFHYRTAVGGDLSFNFTGLIIAEESGDASYTAKITRNNLPQSYPV